MIRKRPSPAFVLAFIALLIAIGGTALALDKNSVGARELGVVLERQSDTLLVPDDGTAADGSYTTESGGVRCKKGEQVLSGGVTPFGPGAVANAQVGQSIPKLNSVGKPIGWFGSVHNDTGAIRGFKVVALCLRR